MQLNRFLPPERIVHSCRVGKSKSSDGFEMFTETLAALNRTKDECIFFHDHKWNIESAVSFGLTSALVPADSEYGANYLRRILYAIGIDLKR